MVAELKSGNFFSFSSVTTAKNGLIIAGSRDRICRDSRRVVQTRPRARNTKISGPESAEPLVTNLLTESLELSPAKVSVYIPVDMLELGLQRDCQLCITNPLGVRWVGRRSALGSTIRLTSTAGIYREKRAIGYLNMLDGGNNRRHGRTWMFFFAIFWGLLLGRLVIDGQVDDPSSSALLSTVGSNLVCTWWRGWIRAFFQCLVRPGSWKGTLNSSGVRWLADKCRMIRGRGSDNRSALRLCHSFSQLLPLREPRTRSIDDDIVRVAWCTAEQVEDHHTVSGIRLHERISRHPNLPYFRKIGKSGNLHRIGKQVVSKIQPFQGKKPFDTRQ